MDEDPLSGYGLKPVALTDQAVLTAYFQSLTDPLSDYTFSQLYTWRNSLRIVWRELEGHLCVFANGTGDLTLLMPPIGDGNGDRAMAAAWEIMDDYNAAHGVPDRSRIEYASEELLARFDRARLNVQPLGTDYVYDVNRMIDLAGGDLASKRQAKNRFLRNYKSRVETYDHAKHFDGCRQLLNLWKDHQDQSHAADAAAPMRLKRQKESLATQLALEYAGDLGFKGMVVYVTAPDGSESIRGFTFGEPLGTNQSSIVIEKTDLEIKGLAQFIFSEFCREDWADRPLVNVGDDWGLETLAWTKMSYRPVKLLQKYVLGKVGAGAGGGLAVRRSRSEAGGSTRSALPSPSRRSSKPSSATRRRKTWPRPSSSSKPASRLLPHQAATPVSAAAAEQHLPRRRAGGPGGRRRDRAGSPSQEGDVRPHLQPGRPRRVPRPEDRPQADGPDGRRTGRPRRAAGLPRSRTDPTPAPSSSTRASASARIGTLPDYYGQGRDGVHMMRENAEPPRCSNRSSSGGIHLK